MSLELVSFKLCPFVQRAVITLKHHGIDYDITYINLDEPPEWFHEVSPMEKVPVLRVDGEHNMFESAVIAEYLDSIAAAPVQPADPLQRAMNKSWTELGSACLGDLFELTGAQDEPAYKRAKAALVDKLELFEEQIQGPFFNGDAPALIDFSTAPLLMRLSILGEHVPVFDRDELPKLAALSDRLLAMDEVRDSVVPELPMMYRMMVNKRSPLCAEMHQIKQ